MFYRRARNALDLPQRCAAGLLQALDALAELRQRVVDELALDQPERHTIGRMTGVQTLGFLVDTRVAGATRRRDRVVVTMECCIGWVLDRVSPEVKQSRLSIPHAWSFA